MTNLKSSNGVAKQFPRQRQLWLERGHWSKTPKPNSASPAPAVFVRMSPCHGACLIDSYAKVESELVISFPVLSVRFVLPPFPCYSYSRNYEMFHFHIGVAGVVLISRSNLMPGSVSFSESTACLVIEYFYTAHPLLYFASESEGTETLELNFLTFHVSQQTTYLFLTIGATRYVCYSDFRKRGLEESRVSSVFKCHVW